jgi:hypothetical protein
MARPPEVDDLYTRCLETRDLERTSVKACEVEQQEGGTLVLRTRSDRYQNRARRPEFDDWMALLPREGPAGTLRIDVVSDGVLRVRYAEGGEVP